MGGNQSGIANADVKWIRDTIIIGYKGFDSNMKCLGMQYEVGKTYEIPEEDLSMCKAGYHFCRVPVDVNHYYPFGVGNLYAKIKAEGLVGEELDKCATNKITILQILTESEMLAEMPSKVIRADGDIESYKNGKLHSDTGPAVIGPKNHEVYAKEGLIHRIGGPAETIYDPSDGYHCEKWYLYGKCHRIDGPAEIRFDKRGGFYQESYYIEGKLHRSDGPAVIYRDISGDVYREEYWVNGEKHRDGDQPAIIQHKYIMAQVWYKNDQLFREHDKPAIVFDCVKVWSSAGNILLVTIMNQHCNDYSMTQIVPGLQHPTPEFLATYYQTPSHSSGCDKIEVKYTDCDCVPLQPIEVT